MLSIMVFIILILIPVIYPIYNYIKRALSKKKNLEDYFGLKELKQNAENLNKRETILIFHCEKLVKKYFSKLVIFNKEYAINVNDIIQIKAEKMDVLSSDFTENIILKSDYGTSIDFVINVSYNMNNHYQLILDKIGDPLSVEIVMYSKEDKFPKIKKINSLIIKDFGEENTLPYLKRYNLINIPKKNIYEIYGDLTGKKVEEKNIFLLENINSFFVNFIVKPTETEGRIFKLEENQEENLLYEDFSEKEINLMKIIGKLKEKAIKCGIDNIESHVESINSDYKIIVKGEEKENLIKNILNILVNTNFFNKYFNRDINEKILDLYDTAIFIRLIEEKLYTGIVKFLFYSKEKNSIFSKNCELNNFQKLMIMINIQHLTFEFGELEFEFLNLYDLPKYSPFVESEKLFFDIIKKLKTNSALYFFYLQINSSSGTDFISLDAWYKIKFIPLSKIKAHLMYSRHPFFFIYKKCDNRGAFVNPQNLITNFNKDRDVGYFYKKSLVNEKSVDNTARVLFIKFHESAHSKFECGKKNDFTPRYFLNNELEKLDSHYDSITSFKLSKILNDSEKKGNDIGEEGYAIEMFLYGYIARTDFLLKYFQGLEDFLKTDLYIEKNFKRLNDLFSIYLKKINIELLRKYQKNIIKIKEIKSRNINTDINDKIDNFKKNKNIIKTPIYFFNNYPLEDNY